MAQTGKGRDARPRPVEALYASDPLSFQLENASSMVAIALVHGPQRGVRGSSLPKLHMENSPQRNALMPSALPSKDGR